MILLFYDSMIKNTGMWDN